MKRKSHIISLYNMHSSGSWVILSALLESFPRYFPDALFILPSTCPRSYFNKQNTQPLFLSIPTSKIGRILHSFFIDQFLIPLLAVGVGANEIIHFGNVASYISPCCQRVFFHNALFLPIYPLNSMPSAYLKLQRHYVLLSLLFSKSTLLVQNQYMKSQFQLKKEFKSLKVYSIGNPFKNDTQTNESQLKSRNLETIKKYDGIKSHFKYIALYPSFPHSYKDHHFLLAQAEYLALKSIHVVFTCSHTSLGLTADIADNGLSGVFSFLGSLNQSELECLYQISDLVLFPSRVESLGMPIIEAAIHRKPLLVPALPYALSSVTNAYFYENCSHYSSFNFTLACNQLVQDLEHKVAKIPIPIINTSPRNFLESLRDLK